MSANRVLKTSTRAFSRLSRINSPHRVRLHRRIAMPTVGAIVAGTGETVRLLDILSTCVDAAQKGCEEIRAVQARRASSGQLASTMKDIDDPRSALTEADLNAQKAVVDRIRATWPNLRIVGEEDEDETNEVDVSDPEHPVEIGWFDTTPYGENPPGFGGGAWTAWPFFESGMIVVSSMNEGLFIVRPQRPVT